MLLILHLCAAVSILAADVAAVATSPKVRRAAEPEVSQIESGNTLVGAGYSGDSQQLTSQKCYNAAVSYASGQKANMQLGTAMSFPKLERELGISVSASVGYGMFAANAEADYMRSLEDTDYSFSLNYIHYVTNQVNVQIRGYGDAALGESGRSMYNKGENPYFGLVCGDFYLDSYQQGALLTMGFNIKFSSSDEKSEFNAKAGASYGNIVSVAGSVKSVASKNNISGSVTIQAFQKGGEPSQLSNLLSHDSSGKYYALGCSITAMDDCIKAASGLLDYAKNNFPLQVSSENNKGLTPLGIRFSSFRPIEHIGLTRPASLVTPEVERYREELSSKLKEAKYYQQKLYTFFNGEYPLKSDDPLRIKASSILSKANNNEDILMHPTTGAVGCFNSPNRCKSLKTRIDSLLHDISIDDLKFLDDIKYKISVKYGSNVHGAFYTSSAGVVSKLVWNTFRIHSLELQLSDPLSPCNYCDVYVYMFNMTDTTCSFTFDVVLGDGTSPIHAVYTDGRLSKYEGQSREYLGTILFENAWKRHIKTLDNVKLIKQLSPFYFEAFSVSTHGANNH